MLSYFYIYCIEITSSIFYFIVEHQLASIAQWLDFSSNSDKLCLGCKLGKRTFLNFFFLINKQAWTVIEPPLVLPKM